MNNNKEEKIVQLLFDGQITLSGYLFIPKNPKGMVVFAHEGGGVADKVQETNTLLKYYKMQGFPHY
jgi:dienelactone hydrolase